MGGVYRNRRHDSQSRQSGVPLHHDQRQVGVLDETRRLINIFSFVRSGTWMMTGSGIMHNGTIVLEQYGVNLDRLQVGDRVGVLRKESGHLHFFVNSIDQGSAASNVPEKVYGVIGNITKNYILQ